MYFPHLRGHHLRGHRVSTEVILAHGGDVTSNAAINMFTIGSELLKFTYSKTKFSETSEVGILFST